MGAKKKYTREDAQAALKRAAEEHRPLTEDEVEAVLEHGVIDDEDDAEPELFCWCPCDDQWTHLFGTYVDALNAFPECRIKGDSPYPNDPVPFRIDRPRKEHARYPFCRRCSVIFRRAGLVPAVQRRPGEHWKHTARRRTSKN